MPTVTLHCGTVTPELANALPDRGLVGSGAVWSDGLDTTYFATTGHTGAGGFYPADSPLDPLVLPPGATVTNVFVNMRAESIGTSQGDMALTVRLQTPTAGFDQGIGPAYPSPSAGFALANGMVVDTGGVITDIGASITSVETAVTGNTFADLIATLVGGANVFLYTSAAGLTAGQTIKHRVYEFTVVVVYTAPTVAPPLRRYPRSDGLGSSSAIRKYPSFPSIQASNRRGPSAIL